MVAEPHPEIVLLVQVDSPVVGTDFAALRNVLDVVRKVLVEVVM